MTGNVQNPEFGDAENLGRGFRLAFGMADDNLNGQIGNLFRRCLSETLDVIALIGLVAGFRFTDGKTVERRTQGLKRDSQRQADGQNQDVQPMTSRFMSLSWRHERHAPFEAFNQWALVAERFPELIERAGEDLEGHHPVGLDLDLNCGGHLLSPAHEKDWHRTLEQAHHEARMSRYHARLREYLRDDTGEPSQLMLT